MDQLDNTVKDRLHSSYARILVGFLLSLMFLNQILKTILTDWIPGQGVHYLVLKHPRTEPCPTMSLGGYVVINIKGPILNMNIS